MKNPSRGVRALLAKRQRPDEPTPSLSPLRDGRVRDLLAAMMRSDEAEVRTWAKELYYFEQEVDGLAVALATAACDPKADRKVARWFRGFLEARQEPVPAPVYFVLYDWPEAELRTALARAIGRLTCPYDIFEYLCRASTQAGYEDGRVRFALAKVLSGEPAIRKRLESRRLTARPPPATRSTSHNHKETRDEAGPARRRPRPREVRPGTQGVVVRAHRA
jgi:hypothetical protein